MDISNYSDRLANHEFSSEIVGELAPLAEVDNWHSIAAVALDYAIIAAAIVLGQASPWLYPLMVLVIGSRQRALTTILHDAAHGRAAKNRWLNRVLGSFFSGYLVFQAFRPYRQSHVLNHHGHLGDADADPDFQLYLTSGLYDGMTKGQFLVRHVVATFLMLNALGYLWYMLKHRLLSLVKSRTELPVFLVFWAALLAIVHLLGGWQLFLLYWIIPFFTSFLVIGRFIEIAEHYPLLEPGATRSVLEGTRNRFSHPVEALFCSMHNENYHLVHHLRPDIPFWNMRKAHRIMLGSRAYREINEGFGGIFLSGNGRQALMPALASGAIRLPTQFQPQRTAGVGPPGG